MPKATHKQTDVDFSIMGVHSSFDNEEGNTGGAPGWVRVERVTKEWPMQLVEFLEQYNLDDSARAYVKRRLKEIGLWDKQREALRRFGIE